MSKYDEIKKEVADKQDEYEGNLDKLLANAPLSKRERHKIRIREKINTMLRS